jgi:hypothetical protein
MRDVPYSDDVFPARGGDKGMPEGFFATLGMTRDQDEHSGFD